MTNPFTKPALACKLLCAFVFAFTGTVFAQQNPRSNTPAIPSNHTTLWADGTFQGFTPGQEVIEKRTRNAKHFRNANGTYTVQTGGIYHYQDNGQWKDIDLSLVPYKGDGKFAFANETNDIKSYFPSTPVNESISMKLAGNISFNWWKNPGLSLVVKGKAIKTFEAEATKATIKSNTLTYPMVYNGVSEEFVMLQSGIENNTIIHSLNQEINNLPADGTLEFSQFIPLQKGMSIDINGDKKASDFKAGSFHISIPGSNEGIYFSPIIVFDNQLTKDDALLLMCSPEEKLTEKQRKDKEDHIYQAKYAVRFVEGGIKVVYVLPASWLKSSVRSFPVTIDPTVTITPPSPTSGGNFYGPMTNWYGFQRHADIYLASELNLSYVNITDIEYNRITTAGTNASKPIKIYMRTMAASNLTGLTDAWNSPTYTGGLTPLFDGSLDLFGTTTGWKMITLSTPFLYNGDNLLIMGYDAYGGSGSAKYLNQGTTSVTARQAYKRQDTNDPDDASAMGIEDRLTEVRLTYVSAGPACTTPTAQPTSLVLNPTGASTISGSFTAASPAPDGYLVVRTATNVAPVPVNGTNYAVGNNAIGYIESTGTSLSFNSTSLTPATTYYYWAFAYNSLCSGGPLYYTTSPLTGSAATNACGGLATGTYSVGPTGTYTSLTNAINALSSGMTGQVIFELQASYSSGGETFPITFSSNPCITASNNLIIRPVTGATSLQISSSDPVATINFNGAKYITIDGRPGGVGTAKQLSIQNTINTGVAVKFGNDAQNNIIRYADIQGQNTASPATGTVTNAGIVYFSTANSSALQGNDNNTISNCDIHGIPGTLPSIGVFAIGSTGTVAAYNDNNTITNCNIYDVFNAGVASTGVKIDGGNNAWTISNNSFYQTSSYTFAAAVTHRSLWVTPNTASINNTASGFIITGNYIGGQDVNAGGAPYAMAGAFGWAYNGMDISVGLGTATSIQNNVVSNFTASVTNSSTTSFVGIGIANGNVDIGTVAGNRVGSQTIVSDIQFTTATNLGGVMGIRAGGGGTINIANNKIGGIDLNGSSASIVTSFNGINVAGGTTINVTGNTVGNTDLANSINAVTATTGTGVGVVNGITVGGGTTVTVNGNIVANMNTNYAATGTQAASIRGIIVNSNTPAVTISNNIIRNLSSAAKITGNAPNCAIVGIGVTSTNVLGCNVTGNIIDSLVLTGGLSTEAVQITGLYYSGQTTVVSTIARNFIHSFDINNSDPNVFFTAIDNAAGTNNIINNMIRLGVKPDGTDMMNDNIIRGISSNSGSATNIYFNSIYIGGNNVGSTAKNTYAFIRTATSGTYDIKNNILINNRSNAGAGSGGKHYTLYFTTATTGATPNANLYQYTGNDGNFAYNGTADVSTYTSGWIASDGGSLVGNPQFINPTGTASNVNLHIHTTNPTPIEGAGVAVAAVTDDFDGQTRSGLTPVDIGADAGNFVLLDIAPPVITYTPLGASCNTSDRTITATITDAGTIVTGVNGPRIYFRQNGGAWYSNAGVNTSGNSWDFTLTGASIPGGFVNLSLIEYFIAAQDNSGNIGSNPGGAGSGPGGGAGSITTYPTTPASYSIASLSGQYDVGSGSAAPFNKLTSAISLYNGACLTGAVTFKLTDATYDATTETFPLSINANPTASASYTLTIKPAVGNTATITGSVASGGLVKLNGADYVIIDGNNGSGNKDIVISNTNTTTPAAVTIVSLGAGLGATHDTVRNCSLVIPVNISGYGISVGGATPGSTGADNDSVAIHNNSISNAAFGIYAIGTAAVSAGGLDSLSIVGNTYDVTTSISSPIAIRVGNALKSNVNQNTIALASTATGQPVGISLETGFTASNVLKNVITKMTVNVAGGYGGRGITVGTATASSDLTIANNMISGMNGSNWTAFGNSTSAGIAIGIIGSSTTITTTAGGIRLYYNSVNLYGPYGQATSTTTGKLTAALYVGSGASALDIRNNIFMNSLNNPAATAKAYAVYSAVANSAFTTMNYNDYYVSGGQGVLAFIGSDRATLTDVQTGFGQNTNSRNDDPMLLASDNLHIDNASPLVGQGTAIAGITVDIDGDIRSAGAPTIGADEIILPPCTGAVGGTASAVTTVICGSGSTSISVTGFSTGTGSGYQWQSSIDNSAWNDIIGQVSTSVNTGTITDTMYYRFKVTCPSGVATSYSNVVTVYVNPIPTVTLSPLGPITACAPATPVINVSNTSAASPSYQWRKGGTDISGETGSATTVTSSGSYTVRVDDNITTCFVVSTPVVVTINPQPTAVVITPSPATICPGSSAQLLTATGGDLNNLPLVSEDFNGSAAGWTTTNTSTGTNPANAAWTLRTSPHTPGGAWTGTINSNDNSQFYFTNSDAVGSGASVLTSLVSPAFSTVGFTSCQLQFYHFFHARLTSSGKVEVSTNGTSWTTLQTYTTTDVGTQTGFVQATINLDAYVGNPTVYVRFLYTAGWDWGWAIDNLVISGTAQTNITWASTTGLYTDAGATTPYAGGATPTVYAKPGSTTVYTATATSTASCTNNGTVTVNYTTTPSNATALAGTAGAAQACANYDLSVSNHYFNNCNLIATVVSSGVSPVSGMINACVKIETGVPADANGKPYVPRHFDILPATNATTATSTITLYFTPGEFAAYNAGNGAFPDLPTGAGDATGIANLRVTQFNSTTSGGLAGYAPGSGHQIDPNDANIVYNAAANRWSVTFDAVGSGGFYVHTGPFTLPVTLINFRGEEAGSANKLLWSTSTETNNKGFELQRSADGRNFSSLGFVNTKADNGNSTVALNYSFNDNNPLQGNNYYRLKQVDRDGKSTYSNVVLLSRKVKDITLSSVYPNPTTKEINLVITSPRAEKLTIIITDLTGKVVKQQPMNVVVGENQQAFNVQQLAQGTYLIKAVCANGCETAVHRFVKQ